MRYLKLLLLATLFVPSIFLHAERITNFHSDIFLQKNDSVKIVETVEYDSEGESHHGIYRNIPLDSFEGNPVQFSNVRVESVRDEQDKRYSYETSNTHVNGKKVKQIKIGNANVFFQGKKTYIITYTLTHALTKKSKDGKSAELYLNVTGNEWTMPLLQVSYSLNTNGSGATFTQGVKCFEGMFGSTAECAVQVEGATLRGVGTHSLSPGDGMTVKVPLVYIESPFPGTVPRIVEIYGLYVAVAFLFILLFSAIFYAYSTYGKDPETTNPIIPEYDAPQGLTPLQASFVFKERITPEAIIAELLYQGREGNLVIEEVEKKTFLWSSTDYRIDMKRVPLVGSSQLLLSALLVNRGRNIFTKKEATQESFFISEAKITSEERSGVGRSLYQEMIDHGYYDFILLQKLAQKFSFQSAGADAVAKDVAVSASKFVFRVVMAMFIFMVSFSGFITFLGERVVGYFFLFFFSFIVGVAILFKILNRRTELGVNAKKELEGLKLYIDMAEDDLINFENVPAKTPATYMKLLPWAVFFGLEKKWSKKFESLTMTESDATYFHSPLLSRGATVDSFVTSLSGFQTVSSQVAASVSSSGSGRGGSSGGGGGGGGGGSW